MSVVEFPNDILSTPCAEASITAETVELANDMLHTLEHTDHGVGLSAPQVGKPIRLIVIKILAPMIMFNPKIVKTSMGRSENREGCLSFPGLFLQIKRPHWCAVEFTNEKGEKVRRKLFGVEAVCVQHEVDHLDGVVFTQRYL